MQLDRQGLDAETLLKSLPTVGADAPIAARMVVGAMLALVESWVESRLEGNVPLSQDEVSDRVVAAAVGIIEALGGGTGL
jgi:hypothetical protein